MKISVALALVLILLSCSSDSVPEGILPEDKMVKLLIKIHIAEAKIATSYLPGDSSIRQYKVFEDSAFKSEGTDKATYENSYKYYGANPERLDKIYSIVVDSLSLREALRKIN